MNVLHSSQAALAGAVFGPWMNVSGSMLGLMVASASYVCLTCRLRSVAAFVFNADERLFLCKTCFDELTVTSCKDTLFGECGMRPANTSPLCKLNGRWFKQLATIKNG